MTNGPDFSALGQVLPEANSIVCFIHPQSTYDAVASATALSLALQAAGKSCEVVCEEPMRVEYNYLVGVEQISQSVGNRDLVISFDYNEEQVDKVSYNIDEQSQRFELIISPKSGSQPLDPNTIGYSRSGLTADLIFLFGYHSLDELGEVYHKERYTIDRAYTVALTQNKVQNFAKMHLALRPENFSYSEIIYFLIRQLQLSEVQGDLATNILSGMEYATERFQQDSLPARVFETVATLLRQGAQRQPTNPAFEHLNTPIRQLDAPANSAMPSRFNQAMGAQAGQAQSQFDQFPAQFPAQPSPIGATQYGDQPQGQGVLQGQAQVHDQSQGQPQGQPQIQVQRQFQPQPQAQPEQFNQQFNQPANQNQPPTAQPMEQPAPQLNQQTSARQPVAQGSIADFASAMQGSGRQSQN